jgi:hypothetical protein
LDAVNDYIGNLSNSILLKNLIHELTGLTDTIKYKLNTCDSVLRCNANNGDNDGDDDNEPLRRSKRHDSLMSTKDTQMSFKKCLSISKQSTNMSVHKPQPLRLHINSFDNAINNNNINNRSFEDMVTPRFNHKEARSMVLDDLNIEPANVSADHHTALVSSYAPNA